MSVGVDVTVVANSKGGVGKTTLASEIVAALAGRGVPTLAIDLDRQGNLGKRLGILPTDAPAAVTADVLAGRADLPTAAYPAPALPGVDLVLGTNGIDAVLADPPLDLGTCLRDALPRYGDRWPAVVIDCPPTIARVTQVALAAATRVVGVIDPGGEALDELTVLEATLAAIRARVNPQAELTWIVPNGFATHDRAPRLHLDVLEALHEQWPGKVTPVVRRSTLAGQAYLAGTPTSIYAPGSPITADWAAVTRTILGADHD